ncbi:CYTH domain-containing protein [Candidatus Saccharibacteria bacterium]|nr:CYTH domain-containing protein [Candidatus Saccharibacteria bacterium]
MKKIIVKAKIKGHDEFEQKVAELGFDFGPVYWQHDRVYVPRGYKRGQNYPRMIMRTEMRVVDRPARYFLILKRHIEDSNTEVEYETLIKDYTEAVGMAMQLGFELYAEVSRKRQDLKIKDGQTLYLDKVEGTNGFFAKIEAEIPEGRRAETIRKEVLELFDKTLEQNFSQETYAEMIRK